MAEPKGILHIVDCLHMGGTERQLYELLRHTDRTVFRPLVATFHPGGDLLEPLRDAAKILRPPAEQLDAVEAHHAVREDHRITKAAGGAS